MGLSLNPINLPTGIRGDVNTPKQQEFLVNLFVERGERPTASARPGIVSKGEIYGKTRGQIFFNNAIYRISADKIFKLTIKIAGNVVAEEQAGTITGSADVVLVASFTQLFIGVKGGDSFVISVDDNGVETFDAVPAFNGTGGLKPVRDCEFLDSRFVAVPFDGGPIQWSKVGDAREWPIENRSDAEQLPDDNFQIIENDGLLLVGGERSIERLNYDPQRNIYASASQGRSDHGVVSDFARFYGGIVYLGKYENGQVSVFNYGNDIPISSKGVDEILNQYTVDELRNVRVESFTWRGQNMVTWRLPEETLYYYGDFGTIKTGVSGNFKGVWAGQYIASLGGRLLCGDNQTNRIGLLSDVSEDYGEQVEYVLRTYLRGTPRDNFRVGRIAASVTTGQSNEPHTIALSVSEDGVQGYRNNERYEDLGPVGVFNNEISWQQIGNFDNFCGIQLRWVTDIKVPMDALHYE